jgi:hypothetical protein
MPTRGGGARSGDPQEGQEPGQAKGRSGAMRSGTVKQSRVPQKARTESLCTRCFERKAISVLWNVVRPSGFEPPTFCSGDSPYRAIVLMIGDSGKSKCDDLMRVKRVLSGFLSGRRHAPTRRAYSCSFFFSSSRCWRMPAFIARAIPFSSW